MRSIHIYCDGGFGNRFNALVSGLAIARAFGLTPIVVWPMNNWCGAAFEDLFEQPGFEVQRHELVSYVPLKEQFQHWQVEDHLGMNVPNVSPMSMSSMETAQNYAKASDKDIFYYTALIPPFLDIQAIAPQVRALRFRPEIMAEAETFLRSHQLDQFFGVQIRKTDFGKNGADDAHLFELIRGLPQQRFFVCSDDKDVEARFRTLPNVVTYPKRAHVERLVNGDWNAATLDHSGRAYTCNVNRSAVSVVDAIVDLMILSHSQVVRTSGSTFLSTALLLKECRQLPVDNPAPQPQSSVEAAREAAPGAAPSAAVQTDAPRAAATKLGQPNPGLRPTHQASPYPPPMKKIDRVISVCTSKDLSYWKVASQRLLEYVDAESYEVIVPDDEVQLFRQATPSRIQVIPEVYYCGTRDLAHLRQHFPAAMHQRAGWYLQQFLKVEAIRRDPREVNCLIWDADTVPLRRMEFVDDAGRLVYRASTDRPPIHQPYFDLIESLLGISREIDDSFISQCFPVKTTWVRELCDQLVERHRVDSWWDAVVAYVAAHPSACGFSEYETLGSFILKHHREEMLLGKPGSYFRPANQLFPLETLDRLPTSRIAESLEYLTYNSYGPSDYGGLNIGCGNTRLEATYDGKRFLNVDIQHTTASDLTLNLDYPLPFADNAFTHIVAHNVLEHVDDVMFSIKELDRVLAPGGVLQIEVPHIGSYNHGTDVTHKRGLTFDSFNFLLHDRNYLYTRGNSPFKYRLVSFTREIRVDGQLTQEVLDHIPRLGTYPDWIQGVRNFEIPGTFGYVFQKL